MSRKRGYQCNFVAKQLELDMAICEIQYHCFSHTNLAGQPCSGISFARFCHSMGTRLSFKTREWTTKLIQRGLTPTQVLTKYKRELLDLATHGKRVSRDAFIMPIDVYNIANKHARQLWMRHS